MPLVLHGSSGVPDEELARDVPATFRKVLYAASGTAPPLVPIVPPGGGFLDICPDPAALPGWLAEGDIGVFAAEFAAAGFTGPLNWYRNLDRNWELTAPWHHAPVTVPALYVAGDRDFVLGQQGPDELVAATVAVRCQSVIQPPDRNGCRYVPRLNAR